METKCQSPLYIRDQSIILVQFNDLLSILLLVIWSSFGRRNYLFLSLEKSQGKIPEILEKSGKSQVISWEEKRGNPGSTNGYR